MPTTYTPACGYSVPTAGQATQCPSIEFLTDNKILIKDSRLKSATVTREQLELYARNDLAPGFGQSDPVVLGETGGNMPNGGVVQLTKKDFYNLFQAYLTNKATHPIV